MSLTNYPNGVSSFGVPVLGGAGGMVTTGNVWFVDSTTGSDGNSGQDKDHPFATIDYAIGRCTANKGDVILVMPNHSETITAADGINVDIEGVSIIGLGVGNNRPEIAYSTSTAASFGVNADSVLLKNLYFDMTGVDGMDTPLDIDDNHCTIEDCEFLVGDATYQADEAINADANADNLTIRRCKFISGTAGANYAIHISGALTNLMIDDVWCDGDFAVAPIGATTAFTQALIRNVYAKNDQTGDLALEFTGAATGFMVDCYSHTDCEPQNSIDPGSLFVYNVLACHATDKFAVQAQASDSS